MAAAEPARATAAESPGEKRTGFLELFFDLVFVYAVTQVSSLIESDPTAKGFARGALALALIWWAWSAYAWLTNGIDVDDGPTRAIFMTSLAAAFFVAFALPEAFADDGAWFGVALLALRALWLPLYLRGLRADPEQRTAVLHLAPFFLISPALIAIGGFLDDPWRTAIWVVAVVIDVAGTLEARRHTWRISPHHFSERYQLIVMIALGESIVAIGVGAAAGPRDAALAAGIAAALAGAAVLWWAYFDWIATAAERGLAYAAPARQPGLARDVYTYFHLPIVAGVILYAVAARAAVGHPGDALHGADRFALAAGFGLCLLGFLLVRYRFVHAVAWERGVAGLMILLLCLVGGSLPALAMLALSVAFLAAALAVESVRLAPIRRRFRTAPD